MPISGNTTSYIPTLVCNQRPAVDVAVEDVNTFFRVLRFVAAHADQLFLTASPLSTPSPPPAQSPASTATASEATEEAKATPAVKPDVMGVSRAVGNRISLPFTLKDPLERFRRMAVTVPVDYSGLAEARMQMQRVLETLCSATEGGPALLQALKSDVFCQTEDVLVESDSTEFVKGELVPPLPSEYKEPGGTQVSEKGPKKNEKEEKMTNKDEMQEIVPGLWCGSWRPSRSKALLKHYGITHICCCIGTEPPYPADFMYYCFASQDAPEYNITQYFDRAFEFIENGLVKTHGNVLVHCGAGISRAPTIVASYLMRKLRISSTLALQLVQHHRFQASPNAGFRQQLHEYAAKLEINEPPKLERAQAANAGMKYAVSASKPQAGMQKLGVERR